MNGDIKSMTLNEFLRSNEYGPLTKFFVLYRMQAIQEAQNPIQKERTWNKLKERLKMNEL
jgi:hypothetical protein